MMLLFEVVVVVVVVVVHVDVKVFNFFFRLHSSISRVTM